MPQNCLYSQEIQDQVNMDKQILTASEQIYLKCHTNALPLIIECGSTTITYNLAKYKQWLW